MVLMSDSQAFGVDCLTLQISTVFSAFLNSVVANGQYVLSCHGSHWRGYSGDGMYFVHFSSVCNSESLWTFFPQHDYGVDMYYVGMYQFDVGSWIYLCFSSDYSRDLSATSFFLMATTDPFKAALFTISSSNGTEVGLMTTTVEHGPLWLCHSGPEGSPSCMSDDIRAGTARDGPFATWAHLGQWHDQLSLFSMSDASAAATEALTN